AGAGDLAEVGIFGFQGDRSPLRTFLFDTVPDNVDNFLQRLLQFHFIDQIRRIGALAANGFADAVGFDFAVVHAARGPVEITGGLAEMLLQEGFGLRPQIRAAVYAKRRHAFGGFRTHAKKAPDRQAGNKLRALMRLDNTYTVRLVLVRCNFGDELVIAYPRA